MKMILEIILIVVLIAAIFFLFLQFAPTSLAPLVGDYEEGTVCIGKNCFIVEIAKTEVQRDTGLMGRKELAQDRGMLFVFDEEGIYPFWMKNTLIPLDMVWIDANKKAVFIGQNVTPCKGLICPSVFPSGKAKFVLEINAGLCQQMGLKVGDSLEIK